MIPTKLLWVDLEMTGLDPTKDVIQEVSAKVTDFDFNVLGEYTAVVQHDQALVEGLMQANPWFQDHLDNQRAFIESLKDSIPQAVVVQKLVELITEQFDGEPAILAGNSIHSDRAFIKVYWPEVDKLLHYRMLDVSSLKVFMQGKYGLEFTKKETHRADDDIIESIAELEFYLDWLKGKQ